MQNTMSQKKTCTTCERELDLNPDIFRWVKSRNVWYARCRECEKRIRREQNSRNREKKNAQQKAWRDKNKDKVAVSKKKDYDKRKARAVENMSRDGFSYCQSCLAEKPLSEFKHVSQNKTTKTCLNCRKHDLHHYEKNKAEKQKNMRNYHKNNIDMVKLRKKLFYQENKDAILEYNRKYYKNNTQFRVASSLRRRLRSQIGSGSAMLELLSCDRDTFEKWFEFNFELDDQWDMSWYNYGEWQIDHVRPCCSFDMLDQNQVKKCFSWKNTAPLPSSLNQSKNGKICQMDQIRQEIRVKLFLKQLDTESD